MDILDDLEKTLTDFELPSDLSPHALRGKYKSIITVAKEQMAKAEEDIPSPPNQLALGVHKKEPILWHAPISEKQACEQEFLIKMVRGYEVVSVEEIMQIVDLGDDEAAIKTLRQSFTDTHCKTVTGHNHLLTLYRIFGVSILLDPSVEMHTKTGTPTFSSSFADTLDILHASLEPFTGVLSKCDNKNWIFLVNFLCAVGTKSVYAFIKEFIESLDDQDDE
ncbi:hypothetical protein IW261DRAFT_1420075 [Armillaria novae-zelandiae]|uniref:Uncharacterized protein n=1 Tax=Armillaria novae-zelandiae TaxID=153914 RepID=A0AA39P7I1_9AGAR|nr:hypothetical protein IW261DRAFT_1420075 [Armillaria novae-zelandiae]